MDSPAGDIPASQLLEVVQLARAVEAPSRTAWLTQEVEVMADEEDDPIAHQTLEQVGTDLVVNRSVDRFSHVVEQGRSPELVVVGGGTRLLEDLERMKECVALGMIANRLGHAIEPQEQLEEIASRFEVHLP